MKSPVDLLPGLPYGAALECLIRVPFENLQSAASVNRGWKSEIEHPKFYQRRKAAGLTRPVIVMAQAWTDPTLKSYSSKHMAHPFYRLVACHPDTGKWSDLPPILDLPDGLPIICRLVGVGSELVILGGCDAVDWRVLDSVFIYNFLSGTWRRGAHMPGGERLFFGCTTDSNRMVYVAGGHDNEKIALKSAMAYDVAEDKWTRLPDMAKARDECKGIFHGGKFHVIGGYPTEAQGRFSIDSEAFDVATWQWGPVEEGFLKDATHPTGCVINHSGQMYMCNNGNIMAREGVSWKVLAKLPIDARHVDYVMTWHGKLLVIGSSSFEEPHIAYSMDLESCIWTRVEAPNHYLGHVQSGCCLEV